MASHMKDWLGKTIEDELREAIDWKRSATSQNSTHTNAPPDTTAVRDFTVDKKFEHLYRDDGSNLCVHYIRAHRDLKVVQLLSVS